MKEGRRQKPTRKHKRYIHRVDWSIGGEKEGKRGGNGKMEKEGRDVQKKFIGGRIRGCEGH